MASNLPHGSQRIDYFEDQRAADEADEILLALEREAEDGLTADDLRDRAAEAAQDRGMRDAKEE